MTAINQALEGLSVGELKSAGRLAVLTLHSGKDSPSDYLLLDAAQAEGLATVSEVSEDGSVPELLLNNRAELPLFLLDGEELVGAKQNRIVNLSTLVPSQTEQRIPVSCVEAGRWDYQASDFASSNRVFFSRGRARKSADVTRNLAASGSRHSNQSAVWDDVGEVLTHFDVISDTAAVSDLYERESARLDDLAISLSSDDGSVGAVFLLDGEVAGLEVFDSAATWKKLMPKVLRGYGIDAIRDEQPVREAPSQDEAREKFADFMSKVLESPVERFESAGEGEDMRLVTDQVSGGALLALGRIIHLCAFSMSDDSSDGARAGRRAF